MSFLRAAAASARSRIPYLPGGRPAGRPPEFTRALAGRASIAVIAELKRGSPSRGVLAPEVDAREQALLYAGAGAAAISVLTEPEFFGGSLADLESVARAVEVPVLMKDFFVSPEQVRVAALFGAAAFLVMLRLVDDVQLAELLAAGREYGLTPLLEAHDERDLARALPLEGVLGINNRDLDTLRIDRATVPRLACSVPEDRVLVAESGYLERAHVHELRGRLDAVLIGSALMTHADPGAFLRGMQRCE